MRNLFETCRVHAEGAVLDQWRNTIQTGKTIDFHNDIAITFLSYLKAFGLQEFYTAEKLADNVSKILNAIPKRVTDKWWYMVSDEKVCFDTSFKNTVLEIIYAFHWQEYCSTFG